MLNRKHVARGFTLVEILIVVVILGILAAIVIPQFTSASESAKSSSLVTQLQTIRSQLELYQVQHNGNYPTLVELNADWGVMTSETDVTGAILAGNPFGPYLQQPPANAFVTSVGDVNIDLAALGAGLGVFTANVGWGYDETTGSIKAMVPNTVDAASLNITNGSDHIVQAAP